MKKIHPIWLLEWHVVAFLMAAMAFLLAVAVLIATGHA